MAPNDPPKNDEELNGEDLDQEANAENVTSDSDLSPSDEPANKADFPEEFPGDFSTDEPEKLSAATDVPLEEIPELDREDLRADTLEFERINRRTKPKRNGLKLLIVVLVLAGGGYAAWSQWGDELLGRNVDELPVVHAPETPLKVRPTKPGGIDIPNRDKLVYDRLEKKPPEEKTENLLPRPEVPLTPPAPKSEEKVIAEKAEVTPKPEEKPKEKPVVSETVGGQPTPSEVKAVKKPEPAPEPPKIEKPVVKAAPATTPAKPVASTVKKITAKSYQIQLAAVRNAAAAKKEWARLQKRHTSLLGKLSLNVVRADLGKKGIFYRLRAGPLADQSSAKSLCQSLAKLKVGCLVIRPGR